MLKRSMRITRLEFDLLKGERPKRFFYGALNLLWYPSKTSYKVAVVVSKKHAKTAVLRHALKRAVYTTVLDHPTYKGWLVFYVQSPITRAMLPDVKKSTKMLLKNL